MSSRVSVEVGYGFLEDFEKWYDGPKRKLEELGIKVKQIEFGAKDRRPIVTAQVVCDKEIYFMEVSFEAYMFDEEFEYVINTTVTSGKEPASFREQGKVERYLTDLLGEKLIEYLQNAKRKKDERKAKKDE